MAGGHTAFRKTGKGVVEGHGLFGDTAKCTGEGEENRDNKQAETKPAACQRPGTPWCGMSGCHRFLWSSWVGERSHRAGLPRTWEEMGWSSVELHGSHPPLIHLQHPMGQADKDKTQWAAQPHNEKCV